MEFLSEYGLFLAKTLTFVFAILFVAGGLATLAQRQQKTRDLSLEVTPLNKRYEDFRHSLEQEVLDPATLKKQRKAEKKAEKSRQKQGGAEGVAQKHIYVIDFDGDIRASDVDSLRETITCVLTLAKASDEVVVRLESPGGMVHAYGLAASQLARIKEHNIPLTVCVDKVAASGGYLMACIADRIIAAPFAIIGSIGVVAQLPNFNRLLKKHDIDYEVLTAGEYKRTLTVFGENTDQGRQKFLQDLEETHVLFKEWVHKFRAQVDIDEVSKGEIWYGTRAVDMKLIDSISTSDDYLLQASQAARVFQVRCTRKQNIAEKLGLSVATMLDSGVSKFQRLWATRSA